MQNVLLFDLIYFLLNSQKHDKVEEFSFCTAFFALFEAKESYRNEKRQEKSRTNQAFWLFDMLFAFRAGFKTD